MAVSQKLVQDQRQLPELECFEKEKELDYQELVLRLLLVESLGRKVIW
jgi:hypothetical protein